MATSPHTAPTETPTADGFPFMNQSISIHDIAAAAAAKFVTTRALTASAFAANEEPALNPNNPNHSKAAPTITNGTLFGLNSLPFFASFLLPITKAAASAESPAAI